MSEAIPAPIADYVAAAHGDGQAAMRLSVMSRARATNGEDDVLIASMEGATLARLAAITGQQGAAALLGDHLVTIGTTYAVAGDDETAAEIASEAMALLELTENDPPEGWDQEAWTAHIVGVVETFAFATSPEWMARVGQYRSLWEPLIAPRPGPVGVI